MNTIEIKGKELTAEEIGKLIDLVRELVDINSGLNSGIIAMNAKLGNEENKVKQLSHTLHLLISNQKIYNA